MIELWIPITILAAFSQNLRSALQKHLKSRLSTAGATYVRFFYAVPFAFLYLFILNQLLSLSTDLFFWCYGAEVFQLGNFCSGKTKLIQNCIGTGPEPFRMMI